MRNPNIVIVKSKLDAMEAELQSDMNNLEGPSDGPVDDVMKIVIPIVKDQLEIMRGLLDLIAQGELAMISATDPRNDPSHRAQGDPR